MIGLYSDGLMKDIIIIPTYNEKENISNIIDKVVGLYPNMELWVVDDNSPDGTSAIVNSFIEKNQQIKLFVRKQKSGLGDAYKYILSEVKKRNDIRYVVTMDADGSHDPESIKELLNALSHTDFAVGSRYVKGGKVSGWDKRRLLLSYFGNIYSRLITNSPVKDGTAGFVAFKAKDLKEIDLEKISGAGYAYQIEFKSALIKRGLKYLEVPIVFTERQLGKSKMSGKIIAEGLLMPWKILFKNKDTLKIQLKRLVVLLIFAGALFTATYKLTESPSVWYDEGIYIQSAVNLLEQGKMGFQLSPDSITSISRISVSYPLIHPLAFWFKLFGVSVLTARILMVIILLTFLILAYTLAYRLFGKRTAFWTLLILATFPPFYGNGKSVLGELPGLMYLVASLLCLNKYLGSSIKRKIWIILAGLFTGLCIVTKPVFLMAFIPAIIVGLLFALKRKNINITQISTYSLFTAIPFIAWIFIQFQPGDTFSSIIGAFSNPYRTENVFSVMMHNFVNLFTNINPLYLMAIMALWVITFFIRNRQKVLLSIAEIIGFVFCCFIILAYLKLTGVYRYLFPAQMISLIFFPSTTSIFISWLKGKIGFLKDKKFISSGLVIGVLVVYGCYGLIWNSWVAEYYQSHKTAYWQEYFSKVPEAQSYFFYDTPEVAIFIPHRNYYQYIAPANWSFSDEELKFIENGTVDRIVIRTDFLEEKKELLSKHYHQTEEVYKYTILSKNK